MQQTPNYKLNKPEMGDTFALDPLNQNMDTVDQTLARLDSASADHEQRMVKLENCRMVAGWYRGNGSYTNGAHISLGERPAAVLSFYSADSYGFSVLAVGDRSAISKAGSDCLRIEDDGFWVGGNLNSNNGIGYFYMAFLGDWPQKDFLTLPIAGT